MVVRVLLERDMNPTPNDKAQGRSETLCPRCGGAADWDFANQEHTSVDVRCQDCGEFSLDREEFDAAVADMTGPDDRE